MKLRASLGASINSRLEVRRSNEAALALYRKAGFIDDGLCKDYYPTDYGRENALLMSCQQVNKA